MKKRVKKSAAKVTAPAKAKKSPAKVIAPADVLLTCRQVAAWLQISPSVLVRMRQSNVLPYLRISHSSSNGRVRYMREDVEAFLAAAKARAAKATQSAAETETAA